MTEKIIYDVVVVGSGAGAMTAAITAQLAGLEVLLVEKAAQFGGTSALSGGVAWIPNNPHISTTGEQDSHERTMRYFRSIVGTDRMRPAVMTALFENGRRMVEFLESNTAMKFEKTTYPDYKAHMDGGMIGCRSIAAKEYDGRELGPWFSKLQDPLAILCMLKHMMVDGPDVYHLLNMTRSFASLRHSTKRFLRYVQDRVRYRRGTRLTMGNALMGRLLKSAVDAGVTLWAEAPALRLLKDNERITGVVVVKEGREVTVDVRRGVVLGAGGWAHDEELKRKYIPFPDTHESFSTAGVTGDGVRMGFDVGAVFGDYTWQTFLGTQVSIMRGADGRIVEKAPFLRRDRNKPGFVLVNLQGRRFVNEAWPYNDVAYAMNHEEGAIPSHLICDHTRLRRYGLGLVRPGPAWARPLGKYLSSGHLIRAKTIRELASKLGIAADALEDTVQRNNAYAKSGKDLQFSKGDTAYDRWQGDPLVAPNPSLGPIENGPFYAVKLWPGNLGTILGLLTDENAQVLDARHQPIQGLYACGCDMHHVLTGTYPGGGGSIGPGMTFGYVAAQHLAKLLVPRRKTEAIVSLA